MIVIAGDIGPIDTSAWSTLEKEIYEQKKNSSVTYVYDSYEELQFEFVLRAKIIGAARALLASKADFASFKRSRCNWKYWIRTVQGGFQMRPNVVPAAAIRDIYVSGGLYAFECATAMLIVLYKAMLDTIGEAQFNSLFDNLLLWDWNFDSDLHLITIDKRDEAFPGDILYFKNPDVSPDTPEWQGENVVKLANNLYYGHGIGNKTEQQMIVELNGHRKPNSRLSAYLKDQATYPDFKFLAHQFALGTSALPYRFQPQLLHYHAMATIGSQNYLRI
ncbi:MAG: protein-glutamine gamma-glutamyltransferase [Paenibacillaceae bacterium]